MHEVSLVAELLDECRRRAAGQPIALVRVRHASSISEESLRQAFDMLVRDGALADTTLETESFAVVLSCVACGFGGPLGHDDLISGSIAVCPACGEVTKLPRTAELELIELRLARDIGGLDA
jgi:Zn finger protein HypA/HybF involved in hydrogenase expression